MVLSTENNYYTNIISPVMLLVAPISGLRVKISRFSLDPTIAYTHQHLFKIYYFQFEHCYDTSQNIHTPYSCICLFSLFLQPKYTAVGSFSWHYFPSSSLLCIILFSVSILFWTLTECFSVHFKYFCKFSIKNIIIWHFYSNFSTPAIFFEELEPKFVIHNISIATDDDIIQFGNDVKIYTVYLSRAIIIWGNCLNWLEKTIVSDHIFCQILVSWFGYLLMATECKLLKLTVFMTISCLMRSRHHLFF